MNEKQKYIKWFEEVSKKDIPLVGGKNASLGEMISQLSSKGVNIPKRKWGRVLFITQRSTVREKVAKGGSTPPSSGRKVETVVVAGLNPATEFLLYLVVMLKLGRIVDNNFCLW